VADGPLEESRVTQGGLVRFALRRAARGLATLVGVAAVVFLLMSAAPGDPAALALRSGGGRGASSPEVVAAYRAEHGLDRPLPFRFAAWLGRAALLDLGKSVQDGRPVRERIGETLSTTLALNASALLMGLLIALPAGVVAARRPGGRFDRASGLALDLLFAAPPFVIGLGLLLLFAVRFHLFPVLGGSEEGLRGFVLPVLALALGAAAPAARVIRSILMEAFASSAAAAGRSRGEDAIEEVARAIRRCTAQLAALVASLLPLTVGGSVVVERLFSVRGTGALLADSVFSRDTPVVLGLTLLAAGVVVAGSIASDLVAAAFDPRVGLGSGETASVAEEGR
jgi:ABC-type dipeptide/oligopeptide/nickel transport system permease component